MMNQEITLAKLLKFFGGQIRITEEINQQSVVGCGEIEVIKLKGNQITVQVGWFLSRPAGKNDGQFCADGGRLYTEEKTQVVILVDSLVGETREGNLIFFQEEGRTLIVLLKLNDPALLDHNTLHALPTQSA